MRRRGPDRRRVSPSRTGWPSGRPCSRVDAAARLRAARRKRAGSPPRAAPGTPRHARTPEASGTEARGATPRRPARGPPEIPVRRSHGGGGGASRLDDTESGRGNLPVEDAARSLVPSVDVDRDDRERRPRGKRRRLACRERTRGLRRAVSAQRRAQPGQRASIHERRPGAALHEARSRRMAGETAGQVRRRRTRSTGQRPAVFGGDGWIGEAEKVGPERCRSGLPRKLPDKSLPCATGCRASAAPPRRAPTRAVEPRFEGALDRGAEAGSVLSGDAAAPESRRERGDEKGRSDSRHSGTGGRRARAVRAPPPGLRSS